MVAEIETLISARRKQSYCITVSSSAVHPAEATVAVTLKMLELVSTVPRQCHASTTRVLPDVRWGRILDTRT